MRSSPSKQASSLSRAEALACIPRQNKTISWEELENGNILFTYAIPLSHFFQALHRKFTKNNVATPTKKLELDEMGSFVWKLIDGQKSVREIITTFALEYRVSNQEAETAVTAFLKTLGQRGFIGLS